MTAPIRLLYSGAAGLTDSGPAGEPLSHLEVEAGPWARGEVDLPAFDDRIDDLAAAGPFAVVIQGEPSETSGVAEEVGIRCRRWRMERNGALPGEELTRLLLRHRDLHASGLPLVRADYRHALDVWQWILHLEPEASGAVQLAALFHDIERISSEPEVRTEQAVADYDEYKVRHAARSARITEEVLGEEGCDPVLRQRTAELIAGHDQPGHADGSDAALLEDADALSYFCLNSSGYLSYYGEQQARRKIAWTYARLSGKGRGRLARLPLPPAVAALLPRPQPTGEIGQLVSAR